MLLRYYIKTMFTPNQNRPSFALSETSKPKFF